MGTRIRAVAAVPTAVEPRSIAPAAGSCRQIAARPADQDAGENQEHQQAAAQRHYSIAKTIST